LRVGLAGNRDVPEAARQRLLDTLADVFRTTARRLAEVAPGTPMRAGQEPRFSRFYSQQAPLLRLITGLAEGADALATQALDQAVADDSLKPHVAAELAAVLPFDLASYRASRDAAFRADFDRQAARCTYILTLDGLYEKPDPDTPLAKSRRARAYRGQSALLLRQSDLLVAAANPDESGKAGGTLETVRAALAFELPVVFLHTGTGGVWLIEPGQDLASALAAAAADWQTTLRGWITSLVAASNATPGPETQPGDAPAHGGAHTSGEQLLEEFFKTAHVPPLVTGPDGKPNRKQTFRERQWSWFANQFRPRGIPDPKDDPRLDPYAALRSRATGLNYHYTGLYRGAFFLNYTLAVCAVFLAALSLVLLGKAHTEMAETVEAVLQTAPADAAHTQPAWLFPCLLLLGAGKLGIVVWIYRNTHQANHGDWNDKAVDYRYLAERLRSMFYLPRIGSFQPPAAATPQYASRAVRQSAVDWLFDAITRAISPAQLPSARKETVMNQDGTPHGEATVIRLDPAALLQDVRDRWVNEQAVYHDRNARTMGRMHTFAERLGSWLSKAVIFFVAVDMLILLAEIFHRLPERWVPAAQQATPWLVFLAALLPAAVASLNGIRFQSECRRLAERSAVMRTILRGHDRKDGTKAGRWAEADRLASRMATAQASPAADPAAWCLEVLHLTETIARDFVHEVAEWSVLYAKEVPEP